MIANFLTKLGLSQVCRRVWIVIISFYMLGSFASESTFSVFRNTLLGHRTDHPHSNNHRSNSSNMEL